MINWKWSEEKSANICIFILNPDCVFNAGIFIKKLTNYYDFICSIRSYCHYLYAFVLNTSVIIWYGMYRLQLICCKRLIILTCARLAVVVFTLFARSQDNSTRGSADADKPARCVYRSVKVTEHSTIPYVRYSFLLSNSNFVFKTRHFSDIQLQKYRDLDIRVTQRSLKVIESGTIR